MEPGRRWAIIVMSFNMVRLLRQAPLELFCMAVVAEEMVHDSSQHANMLQLPYEHYLAELCLSASTAD